MLVLPIAPYWVIFGSLQRLLDKFIVQYSNVGPELYAVNRRCPVGHGGQTFILVTIYLSKIGFYHSGVLRWWLAAALGACSSTLDDNLAHSASGEGPSVSSVRVAVFCCSIKLEICLFWR